jgi:hypothetical protein
VTSRILHYGLDKCHKLAVLRDAGFLVQDCGVSISQLHSALLVAGEVDAVVFTENDDVEPDKVISVVRSASMARLVLFQSGHRRYDETGFDLVFPTLVDSRQWLKGIESQIEQRRGIRPARRQVFALVQQPNNQDA